MYKIQFQTTNQSWFNQFNLHFFLVESHFLVVKSRKMPVVLPGLALLHRVGHPHDAKLPEVDQLTVQLKIVVPFVGVYVSLD